MKFLVTQILKPLLTSFLIDPNILSTQCPQYMLVLVSQIMFYSYSKSQQDALFLKFILIKNATCFVQIYCPSSRVVILYLQQLVFVILVMLAVCQAVNITRMTNTYCCVCVVEILLIMDSRSNRNI